MSWDNNRLILYLDGGGIMHRGGPIGPHHGGLISLFDALNASLGQIHVLNVCNDYLISQKVVSKPHRLVHSIRLSIPSLEPLGGAWLDALELAFKESSVNIFSMQLRFCSKRLSYRGKPRASSALVRPWPKRVRNRDVWKIVTHQWVFNYWILLPWNR